MVFIKYSVESLDYCIEALEWCLENIKSSVVKVSGQGNLPLEDFVRSLKGRETRGFFNIEFTFYFEFTNDDDALMFSLRYC